MLVADLHVEGTRHGMSKLAPVPRDACCNLLSIKPAAMCARSSSNIGSVEGGLRRVYCMVDVLTRARTFLTAAQLVSWKDDHTMKTRLLVYMSVSSCRDLIGLFNSNYHVLISLLSHSSSLLSTPNSPIKSLLGPFQRRLRTGHVSMALAIMWSGTEPDLSDHEYLPRVFWLRSPAWTTCIRRPSNHAGHTSRACWCTGDACRARWTA